MQFPNSNRSTSSLRFKFTASGVCGLLGVVVVLVGLGAYQSSAFTKSASKQVDALVDRSFDQIALDTYNTVSAQGQLLALKNDEALKVHRYAMKKLGPVHLDKSQTITWDAVNQFSKEHTKLSLPRLKFGDTSIEKNTDPETPTPIVDVSRSIQGGVPTIWERLPNDMGFIRIGTCVVKDGKRQISTFLPVIQPDGKPNPVLAAVMQGKTFRGIAYVLGQWMVGVYEPLKDSSGEIVGMHSTAFAQESVPALRESILGIKVGKRGQVYSLGTAGDRMGKFYISPGGAEEGVVALDRKDANGKTYIKDIVEAAKKLGPGEFATVRYLAPAKGGNPAEWHRARIAYYKAWDWAIVVDAYESDFSSFGNTLQAGRSQMLGSIFMGGVLIIAAGAFGIRKWAASVSRPLEQMSEVAEGIAEGDLSVTVTHVGNDEIGRLAESFRDMSKSLGAVAETATAISTGDLEVEFKAHSERDTLGTAFERMVNSLKEVTSKLDASAASVDQASQAFSQSAEDSGRAATEVAAGSTSLAETANNAAQIVEKLQTRFAQVTEAAEQQVASADHAQTSLEGMVEDIREASAGGAQMAKSARQGTSAATHAAEVMLAIESQTELARTQIVALDEKGRQIGEIVETIEGIASQTNLLALNAAIEAARAGEQGRGFAVVADEVRKLAEESRSATGTIATLIEEVRATVALAVDAIHSTSSEVKKGAEGTHATAEALAEIETAVTSVAKRLEKVMASSSEASTAMAEVNQAANQNRAYLEEASARAQEVGQAVEEVAAISQEAAASSQELSASSEEVSASAMELRQMSAELRSLVTLLRRTDANKGSHLRAA